MRSSVIVSALMLVSGLALAVSVPGCGSSCDAHEAGGETGEGGQQLEKTETYNEVESGVHLTLAYDEAADKFVGTIHNVTEGTLDGVSVEVHLDTGAKLGPTAPVSLEANEEKEVELLVDGEAFEMWSAHVEAAGGDDACADADGHADEHG